MGRHKEQFKDLPTRLCARTRRGKVLYYYRAGTVYEPLGSDRVTALRIWAERENTTAPGSFKDAADRYRKDVLPSKAAKTVHEQGKQLDALVTAFGHIPVGQITPQHVRQYLDQRTAKIAGNREIALLSHVYNRAREWGLTAGENPVRGVTKNKERPREVYVTDAMFAAVYAHADEVLRDAMDLALLIGQRVADVLGTRRTDIRDGHLEVRQEKTGKPLRIEVTPELDRIITRATTRKRKAASLQYILADDHGKPLTYAMLRNRFEAAREKAKDDAGDAWTHWQFRDIRAKTASDSESLAAAQDTLGHASASTTRRVYRRGEKVKPLR
jgi:integrase